MKKTSMLHPVKRLGYIKCHSSSIPRAIKSPSNAIRYNCLKVCSWSRRHESIMEIRKEATFLEVINKPITYNFFKDFTNERKKINRVVFFSRRPLPNILKYRDNRWDLPKIWKTRFLQEEFSYYLWKFRLTVLQNHYWDTIWIRCLWWLKVSCELWPF